MIQLRHKLGEEGVFRIKLSISLSELCMKVIVVQHRLAFESCIKNWRTMNDLIGKFTEKLMAK